MRDNPPLEDRLAGAVWGHLVGDALGVPYEFGPAIPGNQVRFRGHGAHDQPPGTWSDDGALMLALLDSLLSRGFDTTDQAKRALSWYRDGKYAAGRDMFDIGHTTREALDAFEAGVPAEEAGPIDEMSCGNGSLMRILPLALVHRRAETCALVDQAHRASKVTHGHERPQVACALYVLVARRLLRGVRRRGAMERARAELREVYASPGFGPAYVTALDHLESWPERKGRGRVWDSFWSAWDAFESADSYEEAVKRAVAYGNDTDTTAAIAGGLAGIHWGIGAVPAAWLKQMRDRKVVDRMIAGLQSGEGQLFRVYVIELDPAARKLSRVRKRNPNPRADKPALYVGYTVHTPEERFRQHKAAELDSSVARLHGIRLRPDLSKNAPIAWSRPDAERAEEGWADHLRRKGFTVYEGKLGPVQPRRKVQSDDD